VDARTDVFSLGVMLYEMVAGRLPFQGDTATDVLTAILHTEPAPLAEHAPGIPAEMRRIVTKALRKNRDERYQTVKDLLLDLRSLEDAAGHESKRTQSSLRASGSGAPRRRTPAIVAGLAALAIGGAAAFYAFELRGIPSTGSLAVLPFAIVGGDPNIEYLADGIPESISASLSQLPDLKVMSRTSVFSLSATCRARAAPRDRAESEPGNGASVSGIRVPAPVAG
jgi:serine/threonine protein kinase